MFERRDSLRSVDTALFLLAGLELRVVVRRHGYSLGSSRCGAPGVQLSPRLRFVLRFFFVIITSRNGDAGILVE